MPHESHTRYVGRAGCAIRAALDGLYALSLAASALSLLAVAGLVLAGMVGRWFGVVVPSADQLAGYCVASSIFLGLPAALRSDTHIRVTLLLHRLPPALRRILELLALLIGIVLTVMLTRFAVAQVALSWSYHLVSSGLLAVPLWIPQSTLLAGSGMLTIALAERFYDQALGQKQTEDS